MKSYSKPTNEQVKAALPLLSSPQHERYFFDHLENPSWVGPLNDLGVFDHPPEALHTEEGGLRFPSWPASRFLKRMAALAPSEVARIIQDIRTDNLTILHDIVDAALAMPAEIGVTLVPAISHAVAGRLAEFSYFPSFTDLCIRLAESEQVDGALELTEALFRPTFREDERRGRDQHWYTRELRRALPVFVARRPQEFLELLCKWLNKAVSSMRVANRKTGADHSYAWRPAIEDHEQNSDYDLASNLVAIVRDGFGLAINDDLIFLASAFDILDRFGLDIFKRLKLFLITQYADDALARKTILDPNVFDEVGLKHEYAVLLDKRFGCLTPDEREVWFQRVDVGPKDDRSAQEYWRFSKLYLVRRHLDGARKLEYEQLLAKFGTPTLADFVVYHDTAWGSVSPMTVEDLSKLEFADVVEKVSNWRPEKIGWREPEVEGLASTFTKYVETNATAFSPRAALMKERPAIYVNGFIQKMAEAVRGGKEVALDSVLDLCAWVLTRPVSERTTPAEADGPLADNDWQWTRDQIAEFVRQVCEARRDHLPIFGLEQYRLQLWGLIDPLCQGNSDTYIVRDTSSDDPRVHDYLDHAINSARGKALQAALAYARWVANHAKEVKGREEIVPGGFDQMPEVRAVLERQLKPENRSVEGMAIIGAHINLIFWIDKNWLARNATMLFDLRSQEEHTRRASWAAWNAFVVWVPPHFEYYTVLKSQYGLAVAESATVTISDGSRHQPMFRLGEHLMLFYGRGQLGLDDDQSLLRRFLSDSNADMRRHAISFVGRSFEGKETLPEEVVKRMMMMWECYWANKGKEDAKQAPEQWSFATWFSSGKFPAEWALSCLDDFTTVVPLPQPDHGLIEQLARDCDASIETATRILDRFMRADQDVWRIHAAIKPAMEILQKALKATESSRRIATDLVNYLGRRGYTEFGKLLTTPTA